MFKSVVGRFPPRGVAPRLAGAARFKSSESPRPPPVPPRQDDFRFARIPEDQLMKWSEELRTEPTYVKAFFAQHRPVMIMDPTASEAVEAKELQFSNVWQPERNLLSETQFKRVPSDIASELGAFTVESVLDTVSKGKKIQPGVLVHDYDQNQNLHDTIAYIGNMLNRYNTGAGRGRAPLRIAMADGQAPFQFMTPGEEELEIEATSVKRKRKLKMNRHKYRKRLKEQRTLRRRLKAQK